MKTNLLPSPRDLRCIIKGDNRDILPFEPNLPLTITREHGSPSNDVIGKIFIEPTFSSRAFNTILKDSVLEISDIVPFGYSLFIPILSQFSNSSSEEKLDRDFSLLKETVPLLESIKGGLKIT